MFRAAFPPVLFRYFYISLCKLKRSLRGIFFSRANGIKGGNVVRTKQRNYTWKDKMVRDKVKKRGVESRNIWKYEVTLERYHQRRKLWPPCFFHILSMIKFYLKSLLTLEKKREGYKEFYKQIIKIIFT